MRRSGKVFFLLGFLLILGSLTLFVTSQIRGAQAEKRNAALVDTIESLLPERTGGVMDDYSDMEMPVLEIDGEDIVALVEIPALGVKLPVSAHWDKRTADAHPCRFWGTVYDGSLIVGGTDRSGQFDGFDRIDTGCGVTVTDMTGAVFSYAVDWVERSDSADAEVLLGGRGELTLFARNAYSLDYIILRCVVK